MATLWEGDYPVKMVLKSEKVLIPSAYLAQHGEGVNKNKTFKDMYGWGSSTICNINPGGPSGGSATQYFVGDCSLMGQAKFLRAFYYYELASMYGNVPMRLHPGSEIGRAHV